jgi:hypothetical protein
MSVYGRTEKLSWQDWASPMEKFPGYSRINSAISDLAAVISDKLAKADAQISKLGVSCRPKADIGEGNYFVPEDV